MGNSNENNGQLLSQIRQHASVDTVKLRLNGYLQQCQGPQPQGFSDPAERALRITRLTDNPSHQLQCSPWTTVVNDDALISHLISVWLAWDEIWYTWIDKDTFLSAMQARDLQSPYCSPFLVNIILAWACPYSDWEEVRTKEGRHSDLSRAFLAEARHLFEQDVAETIDIPLVQGLGFLTFTSALFGDDRGGYLYLLRLVGLCEELQANPPASENENEQAKLSLVTDITCWGIYNMFTASMLSYMKQHVMTRPLRRRPSNSEYEWTPYPLRSESYRDHRGLLFNLHCDLSVISAELIRVLFDETFVAEQVTHVLSLNQKIVQLLSTLPQELQVTDTAPASVLVHHGWYQFVLLRSLLWLAKNSPLIGTQQHAQTRAIEAALRIAHVFDIYGRKFGYVHISCMCTQSISTALYTLLGADGGVDYSEPIIVLFTCLRAMSRRWVMIAGIMRMVQLYAKTSSHTLPTATQSMLQDFESKEWQSRRTRKLISIYPQPAVATKFVVRNTEPRDMGRFLEQMDALTVNS